MDPKLLVLILEIFIFLTATAAFISIIIAYANCNGKNYSYLYSIATNWNIGPVIQIGNGSSQCINGETPFITDQWPGTVNGCYNNGLSRMQCGKYGTIVGALAPMPYTLWRGVPLCSTRVQASYLDLSIAANESSCPTSQRSCGIIDTLNNVMCVPISTACPYNYFEVIPKGQPLPSGFQYNSVNLTDATLVVSNINTKGKLLVEININEGVPCADPAYKNYLLPPFLLETYYYNYQCVDQFEGKTYDPSYDLKDSYSYFNLYSENGVLIYLNALPGFLPYSQSLMISNREMKMFNRNYIGINTTCYNKLKQLGVAAQLLISLKNINVQTFNAASTLLIALILGGIGYGLFLIYYLFSIICIKSNDILQEAKIKVFFIFIPELFMLAIFIISCVILEQYNGMGNVQQVLIDNNCFEADLLSIINSSVQSTNVVWGTSIIALASSLANFLLFSVLIVICCCLS